ncbi:MAG: hypothetical protein FWC76_08170 [Defluviitaleaceae bacterium]|nr:hypothetical protein [Defluviitaleaceae bacterium]
MKIKKLKRIICTLVSALLILVLLAFACNCMSNLSTVTMNFDAHELDEIYEQGLRSFETFHYLSYDSGEFIDNQIFELLKQIYGRMNFSGTIEKANAEDYYHFRIAFARLVNNEVKFHDKNWDEEIYLKDFNEMRLDEAFDRASFALLDMDGDGTPELVIMCTRFIYIFKYIQEQDKFILWREFPSTYWGLLGTRQMYFNRWGEDVRLHQLDIMGNTKYHIHFHMRSFTYMIGDFDYNYLFQECNTYVRYRGELIRIDEIYETRWVYMVSLPMHYVGHEMHIAEDLKSQGYFVKDTEMLYFRVTAEQFDELTSDFFKAIDLARENIKSATFTFEEL